MEVVGAVMGFFALGCLAYGWTQLATAWRDWLRLRALAGAATTPVAGAAVVVHGRTRAIERLLSTPAGGIGALAWRTRSAYGIHHDAEVAPFVIDSAAGAVRVEASTVHLLVPETTDTFGHRLRALTPGEDVRVLGRVHIGPDGLSLRDLNGHGVCIAGTSSPTWPNVARGLIALSAVITWALVIVTAHVP